MRETLIAAAASRASRTGYAALRAQDIVMDAECAQGTLFSHFKDMQGLLAILISHDLTQHLDRLNGQPLPRTLGALVEDLLPLMDFMASERIIFQVVQLHSGATGASRDIALNQSLARMIDLLTERLTLLQQKRAIRTDQPAAVLAEGVQVFLLHALGLWYCTDGDAAAPQETLQPLLSAWLIPR